jgi:hypothetical protein
MSEDGSIDANANNMLENESMETILNNYLEEETFIIQSTYKKIDSNFSNMLKIISTIKTLKENVVNEKNRKEEFLRHTKMNFNTIVKEIDNNYSDISSDDNCSNKSFDDENMNEIIPNSNEYTYTKENELEHDDPNDTADSSESSFIE